MGSRFHTSIMVLASALMALALGACETPGAGTAPLDTNSAGTGPLDTNSAGTRPLDTNSADMAAQQINAAGMPVMDGARAAPSAGAAAQGEPAQGEDGALPPASANVAAGYRLGSGDRVRVIVFAEEGLSGEFLVDGEGDVSMPLIGELRAGGLTLRGFERALETRLRDGYLNDPRVSAEILNYRPFFILGEVTAPGTYPFTDGLTVVSAVATAGGYTYRANEREVLIQHKGEEEETRYTVSPNLAVRPGDTIRIPERFF